MVRALRFQTSVPLRFWGFYVSIVIYLLNRLPTMLLKGRSPFEKMFDKSPSLQHLEVFGWLCYATDPKKLDKFAPISTLIVHLGYSSSKKKLCSI